MELLKLQLPTKNSLEPAGQHRARVIQRSSDILTKKAPILTTLPRVEDQHGPLLRDSTNTN